MLECEAAGGHFNSGIWSAAADMAAESEDARLIECLCQGDGYAYEELIGRFQQPVYVLALRLLNDTSDASDVTQEVFLKVFRNIGSFRGQSSLKTWIYRITVNEAHNARRWFFRHRRHEVELDTVRTNPRETGANRLRTTAARRTTRPLTSSVTP
jgi:RNA polymerase sigma-70 factor (ECF subfamily)